jgi:putative oxidoreductase
MKDKSLFDRIIIPINNSKSTILIRLMVGPVFLSEGIQKFLFPSIRGAGRFAEIGLPVPEFLSFFVGTFEILCGAMIIAGVLTRLASISTTIIMLVAIITTKIGILHNEGLWEMLHRSRTDWSMLFGSIFLMINGSGCWSVDNKLLRDGSKRKA